MKKNEFNYKFDEQTGIFIRESDISINWFVSQVLQKENLQISKISNDDLQIFLHKIDESDLRMPDGRHSLIWLKEKLKEYHDMNQVKQGEEFHKLTERYRYIIEQIDFCLMKNFKEKNEIKKEEIKLEANKTQNNMVAKFD